MEEVESKVPWMTEGEWGWKLRNTESVNTCDAGQGIQMLVTSPTVLLVCVGRWISSNRESARVICFPLSP